MLHVSQGCVNVWSMLRSIRAFGQWGSVGAIMQKDQRISDSISRSDPKGKAPIHQVTLSLGVLFTLQQLRQTPSDPIPASSIHSIGAPPSNSLLLLVVHLVALFLFYVVLVVTLCLPLSSTSRLSFCRYLVITFLSPRRLSHLFQVPCVHLLLPWSPCIYLFPTIFLFLCQNYPFMNRRCDHHGVTALIQTDSKQARQRYCLVGMRQGRALVLTANLGVLGRASAGQKDLGELWLSNAFKKEPLGRFRRTWQT